jgi:2-C-methyl-D-erythritol 4-phosphate cytidylyltransferase
MNISVLLSGGRGTRFGGALPKQYRALLGEEVVAYSIRALKASALTDRILAVAQPEHMARLKDTYGLECTAAGDTHNGSVQNGLAYIERRYPDCEHVLFHDAARPFLRADLVDAYYGFLEEFDAVVTAQHVTDSLGRMGEIFVDRTPYYLIQKPEAFRFAALRGRFSADSPATAIAQQLPQGSRIKTYFEYGQNMKITYGADLFLAAQWMQSHRKDSSNNKL